MDKSRIESGSEWIKIWNLVNEQKVDYRPLILLLTDNSRECIDLYSLFMAMQIPVMLMESQMREKKRYSLLEKFRPSWIVMPEGCDQPALQNIGQGEISYQKVTEYHHYTLMKIDKKDIWEIHALDSEIAVLLSTSGSTGEGKFVKLSYGNLSANARSIISSLAMQKGDRAALMLPMSYSYGLSVVNSCLLSDGVLLLPRGNITQKEYWDDLEEHGVQSICGVPYTYELLKKLKILDRPLNDLKLITQAGGRLSPGVRDYLLEKVQRRKMQGQNIDLAMMYGQTEATARMSCFFANRHMDKLDSVGRAIPGGRFCIEDRDDSGVGEIVYEGENVFMGYAYGWEDLRKAGDDTVRVDGKLYTGDMGRLDSDGFLYITGRKKRIVKLYGYRIHLDDLQEKLSEKTNCPLLCIHGEGKQLDRIYIVAERKSYAQKESVLPQIIEPVLAGYHIRPNDYAMVLVDEFSRNTYGKIDYSDIYRMAESGVMD